MSASKVVAAVTKVADILGDVGGLMNFFGIRRGSHAPAETTEAGLKASFMGAGENDEALFWSAVALAQKKNWVDVAGLQNISTMFSQLNHQEKVKLYKIVGRDEQNVTIEVKTTSSPHHRRRGKGGSAKTETSTANENVRGALTIALLASMPPADAVKFLRNSGTLTGIMDDTSHLYTQLTDFLSRVGAGRRIRRQLRRAVFAYIGGVSNLREAEVAVSMNEARYEDRRRQSWYQRDLQHRPTLLRVWGTLAAIVVAAFVYVFIFH